MSRRKPGEPCPNCGFVNCECLELHLLRDIRAMKLPEPIREYPFAAPRKWRADFYFPDARLLVEVEGGGPRGHHQFDGYEKDVVKYNTAVLLAYRLLRFTGAMVKDGRAVATLEAFFALEGKR